MAQKGSYQQGTRKLGKKPEAKKSGPGRVSRARYQKTRKTRVGFRVFSGFCTLSPGSCDFFKLRNNCYVQAFLDLRCGDTLKNHRKQKPRKSRLLITTKEEENRIEL